MPPRRLWVLIRGLPPEAAVWREVQPTNSNGATSTRPPVTSDQAEIERFFAKNK